MSDTAEEQQGWAGDGLDSTQIILVAVISVALTVFSIALSFLIYRQFAVNEYELKVLNVPFKASDEVLESQARVLSEPGYNHELNRGMIPIDKAMSLVTTEMSEPAKSEPAKAEGAK